MAPFKLPQMIPQNLGSGRLHLCDNFFLQTANKSSNWSFFRPTNILFSKPFKVSLKLSLCPLKFNIYEIVSSKFLCSVDPNLALSSHSEVSQVTSIPSFISSHCNHCCHWFISPSKWKEARTTHWFAAVPCYPSSRVEKFILMYVWKGCLDVLLEGLCESLNPSCHSMFVRPNLSYWKKVASLSDHEYVSRCS